ncbi:hypothetical protein J6590_016235 [Homalodisca vitripennis]|nr:hypothetical protein J6590_016235 [Homalodisca vitripennis]
MSLVKALRYLFHLARVERIATAWILYLSHTLRHYTFGYQILSLVNHQLGASVSDQQSDLLVRDLAEPLVYSGCTCYRLPINFRRRKEPLVSMSAVFLHLQLACGTTVLSFAH